MKNAIMNKCQNIPGTVCLPIILLAFGKFEKGGRVKCRSMCDYN